MQDYNLDKNIEIKGMWYLPAHPEKRVAGILHYTPNKTLKLELIGSFSGKRMTKKAKNSRFGLLF